MLAKLAFRNVRRSVRDYGVYFITLVFGVMVFYAFNSIGGQAILFDLEGAASADVFLMTGEFLAMFSVVIACVLGFLILYANGFLIKRRKQEFGTYLMLGMRPRTVSTIVLIETLVVGLASLAVGLALGVALSQGLSFLTAGLFSITMTQYRFVFSSDAFVLTLACFAGIFLLSALFNTVSVSRCKLVDLLSARSKNARFRVKNPWVSLVAFVVSILIIGAAYRALFENGLLDFGGQFWLATGLMVVGTFLFFWSLAGFVLTVIKRTRGVYFRGLALFTMNQIASKVNTAFLSLSVVCIMLFFSLTVFSAGMGLVHMFTDSVEEGTLYDATLTANAYLNRGGVSDPETLAAMSDQDAAYQKVADEKAAAVDADGERWDWDMDARLSSSIPTWDDFVEAAYQVNMYVGESTTYGELMDELGVSIGNELQDEGIRSQNLVVMGQSQFNALALFVGRPTVEVGEEGYAINNVVGLTQTMANAVAKPGVSVKVGDRMLSSTGQIVAQSLLVESFGSDAVEFIVPDAVIAELKAEGAVPYASYLNLVYSVDRAQGDALLEEGLAKGFPPDEQQAAYGWTFGTSPWPVSNVLTADEAIAQAGGMRMMITYLALYIGFVFLITTAAILAVQQLSETNDSLPRYRVLAQLGCDRSMLARSLRTQVLVYFFAPLGLAIAHTVCAVSVLSTAVLEALGTSVVGPVGMTAVLTVMVYGSYLAVTYFVSRGIVWGYLGKKLTR